MYVNDSDLHIMMKYINSIINDNTMIYFRESVSTTNQRLTLKNYFSTDTTITDGEKHILKYNQNELRR